MLQAVKEQILEIATEILCDEPQGMRTGELTPKIRASLQDYKLKGGIHGTLLEYARSPGAAIYQPSRGWFKHTKFRNSGPSQIPAQPKSEKAAETAFYEPFADGLMERQECTKAIRVGGAKLGKKWGTPDVMGVRKPLVGDIVQFPVEVFSAEIKVTGDNLITAFGQACSYKLFSHRSFIVVPRSSPSEDIDRLDSLCQIFGIGLVLFDPSPQNPNFEFRTRAQKHDPDMFYLNEKIRAIGKELLG